MKLKLKLKKDKRTELLNAATKFYMEVLEGSLLLHECINDLVSGKIVKKEYHSLPRHYYDVHYRNIRLSGRIRGIHRDILYSCILAKGNC